MERQSTVEARQSQIVATVALGAAPGLLRTRRWGRHARLLVAFHLAACVYI